jgi:hypothetical protein
MQWLFVATLLLALLAFVFATEIDVDIRSRVSINNNANVINRYFTSFSLICKTFDRKPRLTDSPTVDISLKLTFSN